MGKALGRGQYNNGGPILHLYSYIFGKEMAEQKNSTLGQGRTELWGCCRWVLSQVNILDLQTSS
jgi:hypothetical protein